MKAKSELGGNAERLAETSSLDPQNLNKVDPIWAAEFRGFFWGEGTISVQCRQPLAARMPQVKFERHSIVVKASIGLRSDDLAILQEFQRVLGGRIRTEPYRDGSDRTISRWVVGTARDCLLVAQCLESPLALPFNKARQLAIWRKAVETKMKAGGTAGSRYNDEDHLFMVWAEQELRRLRLWAG